MCQFLQETEGETDRQPTVRRGSQRFVTLIIETMFRELLAMVLGSMFKNENFKGILSTQWDQTEIMPFRFPGHLFAGAACYADDLALLHHRFGSVARP